MKTLSKCEFAIITLAISTTISKRNSEVFESELFNVIEAATPEELQQFDQGETVEDVINDSFRDYIIEPLSFFRHVKPSKLFQVPFGADDQMELLRLNSLNVWLAENNEVILARVQDTSSSSKALISAWLLLAGFELDWEKLVLLPV